MVAESRRRLAADGLLDRPRRPLPRLPELIGVVCGADAAVRKDIESVVTRPLSRLSRGLRRDRAVRPRGRGVDPGRRSRAWSRRPGDRRSSSWPAGAAIATQLLPFSDEDLCRAIARLPGARLSPPSATKATVRCVTKWPTCASGRRRWPPAAVVPDRAGLVRELVELRLRAAGRGRTARGGRRRPLGGHRHGRGGPSRRRPGRRGVWADAADQLPFAASPPPAGRGPPAPGRGRLAGSGRVAGSRRPAAGSTTWSGGRRSAPGSPRRPSGSPPTAAT